MKPTREDIQKAIMLFTFGNMNPEVRASTLEGMIIEAAEIYDRWDDEPDPNPICFNHSCPNNAFDAESGCGSYCKKKFCEYKAQKTSRG